MPVAARADVSPGSVVSCDKVALPGLSVFGTALMATEFYRFRCSPWQRADCAGRIPRWGGAGNNVPVCARRAISDWCRRNIIQKCPGLSMGKGDQSFFAKRRAMWTNGRFLARISML